MLYREWLTAGVWTESRKYCTEVLNSPCPYFGSGAPASAFTIGLAPISNPGRNLKAVRREVEAAMLTERRSEPREFSSRRAPCKTRTTRHLCRNAFRYNIVGMFCKAPMSLDTGHYIEAIVDCHTIGNESLVNLRSTCSTQQYLPGRNEARREERVQGSV